MPPNVSYSPSNPSSTKKSLRWFVPRVHIIREEVAIAHREKLVGEFVRGEIDERNYTVQYNYALESQATNRSLRGGRSEDVYEEEYNRIDSQLPGGASRVNLAAFAAEAAKRKERLRLRSDCTMRSERFSHSSISSHRLSIFTSCIDPFCSAIVDELAIEAGAPKRLPPCIFCAE